MAIEDQITDIFAVGVTAQVAGNVLDKLDRKKKKKLRWL